MLRDIYAPSDLKSINGDPSVPTDRKLEIINQSPITVEHPQTSYGRFITNEFGVKLPFTEGAKFSTYINGCLFTSFISVGDSELHRNGIGSRLLKSAVRYAVEHKKSPPVELFASGWTRLGLVNTAVEVFGQENVAVKIAGKYFENRYGWKGNKELEEIFDDQPPEEGEPYIVYCMEAMIDREQAMSWETPVQSKNVYLCDH
jgi:hypothetical protein